MKATLLLLAAAPVLACIWDSDTLDDEIRGIPEAEALVVTSRWPRHSRAYYEKRLRDLPARIAADPHAYDLYDDVAVALDRLGRQDEAVEWMDRKGKALAIRPDPEHAYRRLANRGTFLAHAGKHAEGLVEIEAAVALNPSAHFGRERFQVYALRYLIAAKADPGLWGEETFLTWAGHLEGGRSRVIRESDPVPGESRSPRIRPAPPDTPATWEEMHTAVAGILRFGGPEGAEFYRALGDLYGKRGEGIPGAGIGNLHLSWWAYHRALDRGHPAKAEIRAALAKIENHWDGVPTGLVPSEAHFKAMKAWGETWLAAFQEAESAALGRNEEVASMEAQERLMEAADAAAGSPPPTRASGLAAYAKGWFGGGPGTFFFLFWVLVGALLVGALVTLVRRLRAAPAAPPA